MSPMDEDRQLIDSILTGDSQAWEQIVRRFSGMVWRILHGKFRLSREEAVDAFQEIFLAIQKDDFHRVRQWRGKAPLDAYMAVVLSRLAQDVLRAARRVQGPTGDGVTDREEDGKPSVLDPPDPGPDPLAVRELAERRHAVNTCRERLGPRDQELLKLRYDLELQYRGIAGRLQLSVNNVGVALGRAEARLRQCLKQHFRDHFPGWGDTAQASV
jgi:RNA polymerase sigma factor (sigma-70 family)